MAERERMSAHGTKIHVRSSVAEGGGFSFLLLWARTNGCPWDENTYAAAALSENLSCLLLWARANGCPWDVHAFLTC